MILAILGSLSICALPTSAYNDFYYNNADIVNNWLGASDNLPVLSDEELRYFLDQQGHPINQGQVIPQGINPGLKDYAAKDLNDLPNLEFEPVFPQLTAAQRKFGVNPAYKSFYDPSFREIEGVAKDDLAPKHKADPTDEVVEDFLTSEDARRQSAKKASIHQSSARSGVSRREMEQDKIDDIYFTTIVGVSSALAVFAVVGAGFCYHRIRRNSKASEDVEYPAYGVTGPGGKESSPTSGTDRKLAQNAQMYHYQHQKQQMIAFDSANGIGAEKRNGTASDCESDEGEEGDYTVYECPGLAPAGEMEVHNPLFQDESTTPKAK